MQKNFTLKRIVCLLAALCLAAGLVGCADMPASSSEESSLPTILVGSDVYPPFNYIGEDGAPTGIDVELAKEAFRRMGYRAEFTIIDWERKTQLLETGDIDCVWGSFTINGREDDYRWAGPYMASRQVVAVMPGSDIETIADLEGRTLAVQSTTKPEELFLTDATLPALRDLCCFEDRVKTAGLYGKKQLWLGIISHRIADGTSVTGTRSSAKALCGLFLDHDGNILDGEFLF